MTTPTPYDYNKPYETTVTFTAGSNTSSPVTVGDGKLLMLIWVPSTFLGTLLEIELWNGSEWAGVNDGAGAGYMLKVVAGKFTLVSRRASEAFRYIRFRSKTAFGHKTQVEEVILGLTMGRAR